MTSPALHPELVDLEGLIPEIDFSSGLAEMRARFANMPAEMMPVLSDDVERVDHVVSDNPGVVVRVHRPRNLADSEW